jgi:Fur family transcriptional regulator, peroxide stress response regulator
MAVPGPEIERRLQLLVAGLRTSGMRVTHQRIEVAREIAASETHPDVETIFHRVRERVPTVSLDTVYRTIATLVDLGLVNRVSVTSGSARYDGNTARHHHFVCSQCGLVRDLRALEADALEPSAEALLLGTIEQVDVQFRGTCNDCKASHFESEGR